MDPVTIAALAQAGYGLYDSLKNAGADRREAQNAEARAEAAKLRGQGVYKDLRDSARYRTAQAPVKAADLTLNLAQQGLDFARDQGQAAQSQFIAGLRDDPRNVGGVLRGLNQVQSNIEGAEQKAGQQAITAQKIIDDSIYAQREGERKRLSGLTEKYELLPSMQEYTSQTGLADTLRDRAASRTSDAIGGALDATVTLAGSLGENAALRKAEEAARQQRAEAFNRYNDEAALQTELANPIPIIDEQYDAEMARRRNAPIPDELSMGTPVSIDPDAPVDEPDLADNSLVPNNIDGILRSLETDYDSATGEGPDPSSYITPIPSRPPTEITAADMNPEFRSLPTEFDYEEPVEENLDVYGTNQLSPEYQGSGPLENVLMQPLEQQVYGGARYYNPYSYMDGGKYIGERGGMTGGEFDHKTNKKAIIDEESGEKEGEMTGGEGVFSEDQLAEIVEFIKEEDEDGLLSYLRNLLEEPQFGYDFA
jgi:hypothetical protein